MRTTPRDTLTLASIHRSDASTLRRPAPPPRASCEASRRASHVLRQACRCIRANSSRGARACSRHRADLGARSQVQPRDDSCRCSSARAHRALRWRTLRGPRCRGSAQAQAEEPDAPTLELYVPSSAALHFEDMLTTQSVFCMFDAVDCALWRGHRRHAPRTSWARSRVTPHGTRGATEGVARPGERVSGVRRYNL